MPATLFDLIGVTRPCTFTVPSLLACIERPDACPALAVSELFPFQRQSRTLAGYSGERYRLLHNKQQRVTRLFDTQTDPYERRDLAGSQPELLARMKKLARAWDNQYCVEPSSTQKTRKRRKAGRVPTE